jgi:hypothetical protein
VRIGGFAATASSLAVACGKRPQASPHAKLYAKSFVARHNAIDHLSQYVWCSDNSNITDLHCCAQASAHLAGHQSAMPCGKAQSRPALRRTLAVALVLLGACGVAADAPFSPPWLPSGGAPSTLGRAAPDQPALPSGDGACTALPDIAAVSEIVRTAAGDPTLLLSEAATYLWQLMSPALQRGCEYISLTHRLGAVALPDDFTIPVTHDASGDAQPHGYPADGVRHRNAVARS